MHEGIVPLEHKVLLQHMMMMMMIWSNIHLSQIGYKHCFLIFLNCLSIQSFLSQVYSSAFSALRKLDNHSDFYKSHYCCIACQFHRLFLCQFLNLCKKSKVKSDLQKSNTTFQSTPVSSSHTPHFFQYKNHPHLL